MVGLWMKPCGGTFVWKTTKQNIDEIHDVLVQGPCNTTFNYVSRGDVIIASLA